MQILKIHKAWRLITRQSFYCVQLMFNSTYEESFNDQCYLKADGTESCGHFDLIESHEIDTTCVKYFERRQLVKNQAEKLRMEEKLTKAKARSQLYEDEDDICSSTDGKYVC